MVDEDDEITAFAYAKLCFNLLICWYIPFSKVEFCGIQNQFSWLTFIMYWKVALFLWFSDVFL